MVISDFVLWQKRVQIVCFIPKPIKQGCKIKIQNSNKNNDNISIRVTIIIIAILD